MSSIKTDIFILKAKKIHGEKYNYDKVEYVNAKTKVEIICPKHGSFWQTPSDHLQKKGCRACGYESNSKNQASTAEKFIEKAKKIHGEKYDYSKVVYTNRRTKVEIICPEHGSFWQSPGDHLSGYGCQICANRVIAKKQASTTEEFIKKARKIHGEKYDYSKVVYTNSKTKVEIICPEHGSFWQMPNSHLHGQGCKSCGIKSSSERQSYTTEEFIEKAREVHDKKYNYDRVKYINIKAKVEIICPKHGSFWQLAGNHLQGQGCLECANEMLSKDKTYTTEEFIEKAREVHDKKYNYDRVKYIGSKSKVEITCPKHGSFWQIPNNHLQNAGCPSCAGSHAKNEIRDFIQSLGFTVVSNDRTLIKPMELDIYIPEKSIAIEYHGLYWHSEQQLKERVSEVKKYHLQKLEACQKNNIRLIQIFEDEWTQKNTIVKNRIRHILGIYERKIGARQTHILPIDAKIKNAFLEAYHIQGTDSSTYKYGAFYKDELVGVMTFAKPRFALGRKSGNANEYELSRFATKAGTMCFGLATKMFVHFIRNENPDSIYSFSDKRWNTGKVYSNIGMELVSITSPNYWYIIDEKRVHRFSFRKQVLPKKLEVFHEEFTEYENMLQNDIDRVWDCGNDKFVWKKRLPIGSLGICNPTYSGV